MRQDDATLLDIAQAAHLIQVFIEGMAKEEFFDLIHAYDTVDWDEVWKTATSDVPSLLAQIEPLLPKKPGG